jgi:hypothetical protein
VCFRWQDGDAHDVEIVDYHSGRRARWQERRLARYRPVKF